MMKRRTFFLGACAVAAAGIGGALVEHRRMGTLEEYGAAQAKLREALAEQPKIPDLIRHATLAPSGHNTQPWTFGVDKASISLLPDWSRRTPVVDPDDHHLFVSLGCLAETLDLAAWQSGVGGKLTVEDNDAPSLRYELGDGRLDTSRLFDAIAVRQSTRSPFAGRKANPADLREIVATAATGSTRIAIVDDASRMAQFADLIAQGNSRQLADPRFIAELKRWLRFNPHDAMAKGDGLFSAASGSPVLPSWLGPRLFDLSFDAATENRKYREQVASSAGLAVFFADQATPRGWIDAGRTCQRFALAATAQGMKVAFINQPVEVPELRARCAELAGWPGKRPDLVMRYGFGDPMPYSCRRPVSAVIA